MYLFRLDKTMVAGLTENVMVMGETSETSETKIENKTTSKSENIISF